MVEVVGDRMAQTDALMQLKANGPAILPSLLMCDFGNLQREIETLERAGVAGLHLDVMDGHFVPNLTYGLPIVRAIRRMTDLPLDVHLMIANPGQYIDQFRDAGADVMTIHREAVEDPRPVLRQIRATGAAAGLAINPPTPIAGIEPLIGDCDLAARHECCARLRWPTVRFGGAGKASVSPPDCRPDHAPRGRRRSGSSDRWAVCGSRCEAAGGGVGHLSFRRLLPRGGDAFGAGSRGKRGVPSRNGGIRGLTCTRRQTSRLSTWHRSS